MKIRQKAKGYNIGKDIRACRLKAKLTQEQTVQKMQLLGVDISRGSYSQIECGYSNVRVEELLAMKEIFDCEIADFFKSVKLGQ